MKLVYGQAAVTIAILWLGNTVDVLPPQTLYNYWLGYKDTFQWTPAQYLLWEFSQPPTALRSDDFLKVKWFIGLGQFRSI